MKKFYKSSTKHAKRIIGFEKNKMLPLTIKELKSNEDAKVCYICGKYFIKKTFQKYKLSKRLRSLPLYR